MALNFVEHILQEWKLGTMLSEAVPNTGSVNQTILATTTTGKYVLRGYRHGDRGPVEREHAVISHVRQLDLPAVSPLPLPDGETILESNGRYYAVFPWATGDQVNKRDLDATKAAAMGCFLARTHRALQQIPPEYGKRRSFNVDRDVTLARMDRLDTVIHDREGRDPLDARVSDRLQGQRSWLNALPATAEVDFGALPKQVIHGDYQETNLFFDHERVSAIIDWDQTYIAPRSWEVLRALHLSLRFDPTLCSCFLDSYRAELPLPMGDLDLMSASYDVKVSHDLWVYESLYVGGNQRVRAFIEPGEFVPIAAQWERIRPELSAPR